MSFAPRLALQGEVETGWGRRSLQASLPGALGMGLAFCTLGWEREVLGTVLVLRGPQHQPPAPSHWARLGVRGAPEAAQWCPLPRARPRGAPSAAPAASAGSMCTSCSATWRTGCCTTAAASGGRVCAFTVVCVRVHELACAHLCVRVQLCVHACV